MTNNQSNKSNKKNFNFTKINNTFFYYVFYFILMLILIYIIRNQDSTINNLIAEQLNLKKLIDLGGEDLKESLNYCLNRRDQVAEQIRVDKEFSLPYIQIIFHYIMRILNQYRISGKEIPEEIMDIIRKFFPEFLAEIEMLDINNKIKL